jgi:coenzyme PQQ precursor peptide PqqA
MSIERATSTTEEHVMSTKQKKRIWMKPIVQDEQAGMEVTSYVSAILKAQ